MKEEEIKAEDTAAALMGKIRCGHCLGTGEVKQLSSMKDPDAELEIWDCPTCGGRRWVERSIYDQLEEDC